MAAAVEFMAPRRTMPAHGHGHGHGHAHAHAAEAPAKKQSKWSPEEDELIIALRGSGMKWDDISKRLPGRSAISCRLHYQNYLERRSEWDDERKNKLARLYERFKPDMWAKVAEELQVPWRAAEAMHWQLGEHDMARRAGVTVPFSLSSNEAPPFGGLGPHQSRRNSPTRGHAHSQSQGSIPAAHHARMQMLAPMSMQGPPSAMPPPMPMASGGRSLGMPSGQAVSPHHYHVSRDSYDGSRGYSPGGQGLPGPTGVPGPDSGPGPASGGAMGIGPTSLAPIAALHAPGPQVRAGGYLPGVAELTTGVSPYTTPAYAMSPFSHMGAGPSGGTGSAFASPAAQPGYGAPDDSSKSKRRGSPSMEPREPLRRRHMDP